MKHPKESALQQPFWAENLHIAGIVVGAGRRIRQVNQALRTLLDCGDEELVDRSFCDVLCAEGEECLHTGEFPACFSRPQGVFQPPVARRPLALRCSSSPLGGGELFVACEDAARETRLRGWPNVPFLPLVAETAALPERPLEAGQTHFPDMADAAPVMIWRAGKSGLLSYGNRLWCAYTGLPPAQVSLAWRSLVHPDDLREFENRYRLAAESGAHFRAEARLRRHDGEYRWMQFSGAPVFAIGGEGEILGSCHDITDHRMAEERLLSLNESLEQRVLERTRELQAAYDELKNAQSQLFQQEKMASIGQLAAGVAHEINNPIGFVNSNLTTLRKYFQRLSDFIEIQQSALQGGIDAGEELLRRRQGLKIDYIIPDALDLIEESLEGTERVRKIVQDLKGFARPDEVTRRPADINQCLESTINIVWNEIKYKATLEKDFGDLSPLPCHPQQLNQVFLNLLVNAAQSIERQGVIRVHTRQEGDWVVVEISDTGCGIPPEFTTRIFEPFFTTKEVGKGTGLGLSISYDIVKKHGGSIAVESRMGEGSIFTVRLPLAPPLTAASN